MMDCATDRPEFGGSSGCTISESKSWGKYTNRSIDASVICDATIALPILTAALFQQLDKR
ncbi:MAG: deoxyhypusine synthase family protein [Kiritimatiellae bacterium]|nr:deoxyhypusine synthase family protein [Kiritimatiellia bacterium]